MFDIGNKVVEKQKDIGVVREVDGDFFVGVGLENSKSITWYTIHELELYEPKLDKTNKYNQTLLKPKWQHTWKDELLLNEFEWKLSHGQIVIMESEG